MSFCRYNSTASLETDVNIIRLVHQTGEKDEVRCEDVWPDSPVVNLRDGVVHIRCARGVIQVAHYLDSFTVTRLNWV